MQERFDDSDLDPDVLEAKSTTRKLLGAMRLATDSFVKRQFAKMIFDAYDFAEELKIKSGARKAVRELRESISPTVSKN